LVVLVVIFAAAAWFIYTANSSEQKKQTTLKNQLAQSQLTYKSGLAQKTTLDKTSADLATQLAAAKVLLANAHFRTAAESIEYDQIIYALAAAANVKVTTLTASAASVIQEQNTTYQMTTFTLNVEGFSPDAIFATSADDTAYITSIYNNILDLVAKINASPDFDTTTIQSISIARPAPMTDADIQAMISGINGVITQENQDAINKLTEQTKIDNSDLTQPEIDALVKTAVDKLIADALKAQTPDQIKVLLDQAGIATPSSVITINVWASKGAN
jgi:hypothetical protein